MRAVIAVMNAPLWRVSPGQHHLQRLVGQLGGDVGAHRPAHYAPRPYVHHERQIQPALAGLDVGDVREPRRVGAAGLEPALDQVCLATVFSTLSAARFRQSGKRTADASDFRLPEHQGLVHPLARAVELDESSMVDHPVDHRGGKLVVAQDRSPFAELDVGGEHHASLLVAF